MTETQRKFPKGTEEGLLQPFADKPPMYTRVAAFTSFTGSNSYNIVWGGIGSSNTDYENNHILIHNIKIVNTDDNNDTRTIYFYQDNDTTNANARNVRSLMFYFVLPGVHRDVVSTVIDIHFPIPLVVRGGCRITASGGGPLADVCYTVLNSSDVTDWYSDLQYRYLSGATGPSASQYPNTIDVHPNMGPLLTVDTLSTADDHSTGTHTEVDLTQTVGAKYGYGAKATVVVDDSGDTDEGQITSVTVTKTGEGYAVGPTGTTLTIDNATIGGAADATCDVATTGPITSDVELWGAYVLNTAVEVNDDYSRAYVKNGAAGFRAVVTAQMNQHAATDQSAANTNTDDNVVWFPYPVHLKSGMKMYHDDEDLRSVWFYRPAKHSGLTYDQYGD